MNEPEIPSSANKKHIFSLAILCKSCLIFRWHVLQHCCNAEKSICFCYEFTTLQSPLSTLAELKVNWITSIAGLKKKKAEIVSRILISA